MLTLKTYLGRAEEGLAGALIGVAKALASHPGLTANAVSFGSRALAYPDMDFHHADKAPSQARWERLLARL